MRLPLSRIQNSSSTNSSSIPRKRKVLRVIRRKKKLHVGARGSVANGGKNHGVNVASVSHLQPTSPIAHPHSQAPVRTVKLAASTTQAKIPSNQLVSDLSSPSAAASSSGLATTAGQARKQADVGATPLSVTGPPKSVTVSHNVLFSDADGRVVNQADATGLLVTTTSDTVYAKPPAVSKDIIESSARERIEKSEISVNLHKEVDMERHEMMLARQLGAARHLRRANRLSGTLLRETLDQDLSERFFNSEVSAPLECDFLFLSRIRDLEFAH